MAVQKLGRVADGVRGDGLLPLDVQAPGGFGGEDHLEVQVGKEGVPEGQVLVHVQPEGDADLAAGTVTAALALEGAEILILVTSSGPGMSIFSWPRGREQRLPEMKRRPPLKRVDGQRAVVGAQSLQVAGWAVVGELL